MSRLVFGETKKVVKDTPKAIDRRNGDGADAVPIARRLLGRT